MINDKMLKFTFRIAVRSAAVWLLCSLQLPRSALSQCMCICISNWGPLSAHQTCPMSWLLINLATPGSRQEWDKDRIADTAETLKTKKVWWYIVGGCFDCGSSIFTIYMLILNFNPGAPRRAKSSPGAPRRAKSSPGTPWTTKSLPFHLRWVALSSARKVQFFVASSASCQGGRVFPIHLAIIQLSLVSHNFHRHNCSVVFFRCHEWSMKYLGKTLQHHGAANGHDHSRGPARQNEDLRQRHICGLQHADIFHMHQTHL